MDYRQFVASLSVEQKKFLTEKTNKDGLMSALFHFGGVLVFAYLIILDTPLTLIFMLLQGIFIVFLFTLLHETVHRSPFALPVLNRIAGVVSSYLIFLPAEWFRYFHYEHHRYTHIPGKDPELAHAKPETLCQYLIHVSGVPTWWDQIKTIFRNAFFTFDYVYIPKSAHKKIRNEARMMILIYSLLVGMSLIYPLGFLVYVWLIPILLGQPFLRLYLMAEHDRCPFVSNMFENTRTTLTNRLVRKLAWNMPFHVEHHTYPSVPFHKLPKLHSLIESHIKETEQGYLNFNRKYISTFK